MYSSTADLIKLQGSSRHKQCVVAMKSSLAIGKTSPVTAVKSRLTLRKMFYVREKILIYKDTTDRNMYEYVRVMQEELLCSAAEWEEVFLGFLGFLLSFCCY